MTTRQRIQWIADRLDSGDVAVVREQEEFISQHAGEIWDSRRHVRALRAAERPADDKQPGRKRKGPAERPPDREEQPRDREDDADSGETCACDCESCVEGECERCSDPSCDDGACRARGGHGGSDDDDDQDEDRPDDF